MGRTGISLQRPDGSPIPAKRGQTADEETECRPQLSSGPAVSIAGIRPAKPMVQALNTAAASALPLIPARAAPLVQIQVTVHSPQTWSAQFRPESSASPKPPELSDADAWVAPLGGRPPNFYRN